MSDRPPAAGRARDGEQAHGQHERGDDRQHQQPGAAGLERDPPGHCQAQDDAGRELPERAREDAAQQPAGRRAERDADPDLAAPLRDGEPT